MTIRTKEQAKFYYKALLVVIIINGLLGLFLLIKNIYSPPTNSIIVYILFILIGTLAVVELKTKWLYNLLKDIIYKIAYSKPFLDTFYPEGYKKK